VILHVYSFNSSINKILYYAIDIISTEIKLFAIKCKISQAVQIFSSFYIIVIMDTLYTITENIQLFYIFISTLINHNFKRS